jgi:hypothetical protein
MDETDYRRKIEELDRLLNDPDIPMEPDRVWSLLAELNRLDASQIGATVAKNAMIG